SGAPSTSYPASCRLTVMSSRIAGSSSTTRMLVTGWPPSDVHPQGCALRALPHPREGGERLRAAVRRSSLLRHLRAVLLAGGVPPVLAHHGLPHRLGDVLGVIAYALDRLGDEHDLERRTDRAWVLHHVADELPHDAVEGRVELLVAVDEVGGPR